MENIGLDIKKEKGGGAPKTFMAIILGKPTSVEATKPSPERFLSVSVNGPKIKKSILQRSLTPISLSGHDL